MSEDTGTAKLSRVPRRPQCSSQIRLTQTVGEGLPALGPLLHLMCARLCPSALQSLTSHPTWPRGMDTAAVFLCGLEPHHAVMWHDSFYSAHVRGAQRSPTHLDDDSDLLPLGSVQAWWHPNWKQADPFLSASSPSLCAFLLTALPVLL